MKLIIVDTMGRIAARSLAEWGYQTTHSWRRTMTAVLPRVAEQRHRVLQLGSDLGLRSG
ncbi:MAG: hypothetical protein WBX25_15600 [Rhodomicrobium sp.]